MSSRIYSQFQAGNASQNRQRWRCAKCSKVLSSKRSYTEHMNVHNDKRPFACDQCEYAAASQMTLRRHNLRNHVSRNLWGYQCAYCNESYMEPASYQNHVVSRHAGFSATFGCKYCNFTTKQSKHFRDHLLKHRHVRNRRSADTDSDLCNMNMVEFLVDDENGQGHCSNVPQPEHKIVFPTTLCSNTAFLECGPDFFKSPLESKPKSKGRLVPKQPSTSKTSAINIINEEIIEEQNYILINSKEGSDFNEEIVEEQNYILINPKEGPDFNEYLNVVRAEDFEIPVVQHEVIIIDEVDTYKPVATKEKYIDIDLD